MQLTERLTLNLKHLQRHTFIILWLLMAGIAGTKLALIGSINRAPISPLNAYAAIFVAWSFWLVVSPLFKVLLTRVVLNLKTAWTIYLPIVLSVASGSLIWQALTDKVMLPSTPALEGYLVWMFSYQLGWQALLCSLFLLSIYLPTMKKHQNNHALPRTAKKKVLFEVSKGTRSFNIEASQIQCITAKDYYAELDTGDERYLLREPMYQLEKKLESEGFMRISRSTIVNKAYIKSMVKKQRNAAIELINGHLFKITQSYMKDVKLKLST